MREKGLLTVLPETHGSTRKRDQAELVRVFGERMRRARETMNISLTEAAKRLGYANPSKLSKIENASDTVSIPLWIIPRAAEVYKVSIAFLFGETEDFEASPALAIQREIAEETYRDALRISAQYAAISRASQNIMARRIASVENAVRGPLAIAKELAETVHLFRERNQEFDDMPLGAKLLRLAISVTEQVAGIDYELKKLHRLQECDRKASTPVQAQLFGDNFFEKEAGAHADEVEKIIG